MSEAVSIGELEALLEKIGVADTKVRVNGEVMLINGSGSIVEVLDLDGFSSLSIELVATSVKAFPVLAAAVKAALRYIALVDTAGQMTEAHLSDLYRAKDELRAALRKVRL